MQRTRLDSRPTAKKSFALRVYRQGSKRTIKLQELDHSSRGKEGRYRRKILIFFYLYYINNLLKILQNFYEK